MGIPQVMQLRESDSAQTERFNYRGMHRYLVTLPVRRSKPVLVGEEIAVRLLSTLRESCLHHQFDVYAYCILPQRLVLIVRGRAPTSDLKALLRDFRTASEANLQMPSGKSLWSRTYLERVLRKQEASEEIARRIFTLPVSEGLAATPQEYPLQGSFVEALSSFYTRQRRKGSSGEQKKAWRKKRWGRGR
jgi:REP element-mobilizing transposase RayT